MLTCFVQNFGVQIIPMVFQVRKMSNETDPSLSMVWQIACTILQGRRKKGVARGNCPPLPISGRNGRKPFSFHDLLFVSAPPPIFKPSTGTVLQWNTWIILIASQNYDIYSTSFSAQRISENFANFVHNLMVYLEVS